VLCPSDGDLFEYYSKRTELKEYFYAYEQVLDCGHISKHTLSSDRIALLREVSADEYIRLRESLLSGVTHIRQEQKIFDYQLSLCKAFAGGLYQLGDSCAAVEAAPDGTVLIKELLTSGINNSGINNVGINNSGITNSGVTNFDIVAAIASKFPAHSYIVRLASQKGKGRRFGMLGIDPDIVKSTDLCPIEPWYGMGLD